MKTKGRAIEGKWIILGALSAVLLLIGAMAAYFITPGITRLQVGQGEVALTLEDNGKLMVTWPAPSSGAHSRLSVRREGEEEYTLAGEYDGTIAALDSGLLRGPFELRIQTSVHGKNLLGISREVISTGSIDVKVTPPRVLQTELQAEAAEPGYLNLSWGSGGSCELCIVSGQDIQVFREVTGGSIGLAFGEGADLELPSYDAPLQMTLRSVTRGEGYVLYGPYAPVVSVTRESLLGSALSVEAQEIDARTYVLRWNETKGDYYEVQEWSGDVRAWKTLARIEASEPLRYETGLLCSGTSHLYRVAAIGGDAGEPAQVSVQAGISALYAAVWPVMDLTLYEDAAMTKYMDLIPAGSSLCVVGEESNGFRVRYRNQYGYVDSNYCMINLPEYAGDYCAYDIANSYSSLFTVHGSPLQYITGEVIPGFENVNTLNDGYLVPCLYPTARKLLTAAQAAKEDGYRLRVYEAFCPNEATRYLYETAQAQLDNPIPEKDEAGNYIFYVPPEIDPDAEPEPEVEPEPEPEVEPEPEPAVTPSEAGLEEPSGASGGTTGYQPAEGEPPAPVLPEEEQTLSVNSGGAGEIVRQGEEAEEIFRGPTYRQLMTDGNLGIGDFLPAAVSAHNRGIAIDVTLEKLDGTSLEMQSAPYDLSWHSAIELNNENAKLLASYMTMSGVGMHAAPGEWWHFQDDDTSSALNLSAYLESGITAEGWRNDGFGWRYRYADGRYAQGGSFRIEGQSYTIDADGYVIE